MDWTKAKTMLIIVFLFTNIFLGYQLFKLSTGGNNYIDDSQINEIVGYLKEKSIAVNTVVPNRTKPLPTLLVSYKAFSKEGVKATFFGNSQKVDSIEGLDGIRLTDGSITVQMMENNELYYMNNKVNPSFGMSERTCQKAVESFIRRLGISSSNRFLISKSIANGYYRFVYGQEYKGLPIYNSYIEVTTNGKEVYSARVVWFDSIKLHTDNTKVISSIEALLKVYQVFKDDTEGFAINGMEQGYFLNVTGSPTKAVEGTAFPVWKVKTTKAVLYINAYDEKLEKMESAAQ